ncbi:MAG: glycosyltransferase [Nevskiaceae bacterium]|nr:MAG: glycosyltransferase [Nevskiaceae bacterium]
MRILGVHLLDDFSGAANVFTDVIAALQVAGHNVDIFTSSYGHEGFIRRRHRQVQNFWYVRSASSRWLTLLCYVSSQALLFCKTLRHCKRQRVDLLYANTLMPAGAVIAAWVLRLPIVIHVHETSLSPPLLQKGLTRIARSCATRTIAVSEFTKTQLKLGEHCYVVYNSLSDDMWKRALTVRHTPFQKRNGGRPCVFMACSPRIYKGIDTFLALCDATADMNNIHWRMALNCERDEFEIFLANNRRANLELLHRPRDISNLYANAHVVLNLSDPDLWLETFALTLLEGMAHGCYVLGPAFGGVPELIQSGYGGQLIDPRRFDEVLSAIISIVQSPEEWQTQSGRAVERAVRFDLVTFNRNIKAVIAELET